MTLIQSLGYLSINERTLILNTDDKDCVTKGEVAHHEQFFYLSQSFQKMFVACASEHVGGKDKEGFAPQ